MTSYSVKVGHRVKKFMLNLVSPLPELFRQQLAASTLDSRPESETNQGEWLILTSSAQKWQP